MITFFLFLFKFIGSKSIYSKRNTNVLNGIYETQNLCNAALGKGSVRNQEYLSLFVLSHKKKPVKSDCHPFNALN